jgi:hypothetical protein
MAKHFQVLYRPQTRGQGTYDYHDQGASDGHDRKMTAGVMARPEAQPARTKLRSVS